MKKDQWKKPELVVLARSNSAEAVLTVCKVQELVGGPGYQNSWCGVACLPTPDCYNAVSS